jgi:signal transduction histidine kinase
MKFSPENSEVIVQAFTGSDSLKIEVIDNGMGIPYEDLKHMFSSFFRAQNVTNIQGTGLGLHIVKRYVELLNGRVQLNSELGKGTTVTMDLPFLPD